MTFCTRDYLDPNKESPLGKDLDPEKVKEVDEKWQRVNSFKYETQPEGKDHGSKGVGREWPWDLKFKMVSLFLLGETGQDIASACGVSKQHFNKAKHTAWFQNLRVRIASAGIEVIEEEGEN